ncbi:MAG: YggS family pyridoxal phosphate-dependent enzyme [Candidatus Acidiferrum sp.]
MSTIADNLARIRERIESAASRAGRNADEITLIAVSKNHSAEAIREAWAAGVRHFGENRVQEWEGKRTQLAGITGAYTSHLIGHLQSNKAARALKAFDRIDSVDEFSLAQRLNRLAAETPAASKLPVLLEVHLGNEETKTGVTEDALPQLAERILEFPSVSLEGLMCIPPFAENPEETRSFFAQLRALKEKLETHLGIALPRLSMGMSHDFEIAIAEGATEIRVGTALFGSRVIP